VRPARRGAARRRLAAVAPQAAPAAAPPPRNDAAGDSGVRHPVPRRATRRSPSAPRRRIAAAVTVAAAPAYPAQTPNGYAPTPQYAPVPAARPPARTRTVRRTPCPCRRGAAAPTGPRRAARPDSARSRRSSRCAQRPQGSGAGAVIGGVLGGVIGNQFGHGLGRAAMTGVGAAGGAIAGNNVERNYKTAVVGYRVHVRLDNGSTRTFERKTSATSTSAIGSGSTPTAFRRVLRPRRGSRPDPVGVGGWVYEPWRDNFYPAGLATRASSST
jgi:uncharacterized protein YcfJ